MFCFGYIEWKSVHPKVFPTPCSFVRASDVVKGLMRMKFLEDGHSSNIQCAASWFVARNALNS